MRRKRRNKKILRIILTALLVVAFVAALGAVLIWKVFVVKEVSVKGNEIYTDKQIEDWVLDEKYSWNSLYVYFENKCNLQSRCKKYYTSKTRISSISFYRF